VTLEYLNGNREVVGSDPIFSNEEYKSYLDNKFEMPDKLVNLLIRFLEQNNGILSKKAREREFKSLSEGEVVDLEKMYTQIFSK